MKFFDCLLDDDVIVVEIQRSQLVQGVGGDGEGIHARIAEEVVILLLEEGHVLIFGAHVVAEGGGVDALVIRCLVNLLIGQGEAHLLVEIRGALQHALGVKTCAEELDVQGEILAGPDTLMLLGLGLAAS